jgi:hypothetical protein
MYKGTTHLTVRDQYLDFENLLGADIGSYRYSRVFQSRLLYGCYFVMIHSAR